MKLSKTGETGGGSKLSPLLLFALGAMAAIVLRADTFPHAGGDLTDTSSAGWDGPVPSGMILNQTGTYTVGSDLSVTQMLLAGGNVTIDLTAPSSGKVTITGDVPAGRTYDEGFYITDAGEYTTNFIKGGVWDLTKRSFGITKSYTTSGVAKHASLTVSDGTVITNCYSFKVTYCSGPFDNQVILTGPGTTVHVIGADVRVSQWNGNLEGSRASLQILDGARFLYPGKVFYVDQCNDKATSLSRVDCSVIVSGAGSLLSGAYLRIGGLYRAGTTASIVNGASLQLTSNLFIGNNEFSSDCRMFITNNATASAYGVRIGDAANSHGNCLTVADGGALTVSDFIYLGNGAGSYENSVIISNANVSCKTFRFMNSISNSLHVCGTDATLTCRTFFFGSSGVTTNATVVLGGKSPSIAVTGSTGSNDVLDYGDYSSTGTVVFRVPAGGYDTTPFSFTGNANFRAGIAFDVDLSECLARGKRKSFRSTLVQSGGTLTLNADQLAAAQASVAAQLAAAECHGSLEKVDNSLVLTVKPYNGFTIILN